MAARSPRPSREALPCLATLTFRALVGSLPKPRGPERLRPNREKRRPMSGTPASLPEAITPSAARAPPRPSSASPMADHKSATSARSKGDVAAHVKRRTRLAVALVDDATPVQRIMTLSDQCMVFYYKGSDVLKMFCPSSAVRQARSPLPCPC